ncbi:hypothetical protein [Cryobacterium shii]|uniref:hypothetical protein n=1 Tax=Cryobacterium shii TaxID=1259235 RepID=UPI0015D44ACF|nr:hypothetical protein [Cryobacterium shii]
MRVLLKEILDCSPDAAWRALRSPAVFREVSSPVVSVESLEADGFPTAWEPGEHPVSMTALGLVPMGDQVIRLAMATTRPDGVRILRDTGRGVSGALAAVTLWDHRMAVAPDPAGTGKTLFRDQLIFRTGALTVASWPVFWALWQWRMRQLKRLAPTWQLDLGVDVQPSPEQAGQASAGQAPAGQAPDGQAPDGQAPAGQTPAGQTPAGQTPAEQTPAEQAPDDSVPDTGVTQ